MRTALLSLTTLAAFAASAGAQANPDFSGTWKRNAEKSDPMGGPGGGGAMMGNPTVVITQTADKLTIAVQAGEMSRTSTYTLDGKESVNQGMRGREVKSVAKWDGASLVIESTQTMNTPSGDVTVTSKEVRTLSEDGKTMTVVTTRNTPRGEMTTKSVFDKQ